MLLSGWVAVRPLPPTPVENLKRSERGSLAP